MHFHLSFANRNWWSEIGNQKLAICKMVIYNWQLAIFIWPLAIFFRQFASRDCWFLILNFINTRIKEPWAPWNSSPCGGLPGVTNIYLCFTRLLTTLSENQSKNEKSLIFRFFDYFVVFLFDLCCRHSFYNTIACKQNTKWNYCHVT